MNPKRHSRRRLSSAAAGAGPDQTITLPASAALNGSVSDDGLPDALVAQPGFSALVRVRVGTRVEIELDSEPGHRVPGEVTFVADAASFTPEKIETRSDRLGQVFRAQVRILEGVERFQPGAEGNVYLVDEGDAA